MIKRFLEFLNESEDDDTRLVDFFASVTRNYESQRPFYTDLLQFVIEEERRDWRDTRKYVKLEKNTVHEAFYKLKFSMNDKHYLLEIKFDFTFIGKNEKDAPETLSDEESAMLNVVLEKVKIIHIDVKSTNFNIKKSNAEVSAPVRKTCEAFLVKMLEVDYDSLGTEIYKIEQ